MLRRGPAGSVGMTALGKTANREIGAPGGRVKDGGCQLESWRYKGDGANREIPRARGLAGSRDFKTRTPPRRTFGLKIEGCGTLRNVGARGRDSRP
jgi:hypothetical protein